MWCSRKWTEINQPFKGPTSHHENEDLEGSEPRKYSEEDPQTSTKARKNLPYEVIYHSSPSTVLPKGMEKRLRAIQPDVGE